MKAFKSIHDLEQLRAPLHDTVKSLVAPAIAGYAAADRFKSYRAHQTHRNPGVMAYGPRDRSPLMQSVRLFYQR